MFGCQLYAQVDQANRRAKQHNHAESGVHLGIDDGQYRVVLMRSGRVINAKHNKLDEGFFPLARKTL